MIVLPKQAGSCQTILMVLLIVGCAPNLPAEDRRDLPVEIRSASSNSIDVDLAYQSALEAAKETMPEAYLHGMNYRSECHEIAALTGSVSFRFIQVTGIVFRNILAVDVAIDFAKEVMDVYYIDADDTYTDTSQRVYAGNRYFQTVLDLASKELGQRGAMDCTVDVTLLDSDWHVFYYDTCDAPAGRCEFVITDEDVWVSLDSGVP